jgi:hypothetical protein
MVEAAIADVVGPAVAAHDPDASPDQVVDDGEQIARGGIVLGELAQPGLELGNADALDADLRFLDLRRAQVAPP